MTSLVNFSTSFAQTYQTKKPCAGAQSRKRLEERKTNLGVISGVLELITKTQFKTSL